MRYRIFKPCLLGLKIRPPVILTDAFGEAMLSTYVGKIT